MRAVVLRKAFDLAVGDVATPQPRPGEVLVRVSHSGICGTDLKIFTGSMPAAYPIIMGHEIAGEVVGSASPAIGVGTRVLVDPVIFCGTCVDCRAGRTNLCPSGAVIGREVNGGFADYVAAPSTHVYPLPPSVEGRTVPLIQVLTTVVHAQRRAGLGFPAGGPAGETSSIAIIGLGASGQLHAQLAKARGVPMVIGISRSAWKRQLSEQLGADRTFATSEAIASVKAVTGGYGADVVVESTGAVASIADAIAMVRPGGTIVLFGIYTATEASLPFYQLYFKEPAVISARAAVPEDFPESIELVASGRVSLSALVTHVLPVSELRQALGMLERDADGRMKIILEN
jgi:2-desacetyl-2-hydroxyethyl bacteriochlorophyllide A dehydrogenase